MNKLLDWLILALLLGLAVRRIEARIDATASCVCIEEEGTTAL